MDRTIQLLTLDGSIFQFDDSCMIPSFEASYAYTINDNPSKLNSTYEKMVKIFTNFIEWLYKMVVALINKIDQIIHNTTEKYNSSSGKTIVVDSFSYIELVQRAIVIIDRYYQILIELQALDHEINKSVSIADDVKDKLKDSTIRSFKKQPSKRDNLENVIFHFQEADTCKEGLDEIIELIEHPKLSSHPKKYTLDFIKKTVCTTLDEKKKMLERLKRHLEISKAQYADRKFTYRFLHSEDIKRNQKILNHTADLISKIDKIAMVYTSLISEVTQPK